MNGKSFFAALAASILAVAAHAQPVQTWGRYLDITVNTTGSGGGAAVPGTVLEFPLLVRLNTTNAAAVLSEALAGGADVRFADSAGNALSYEIEQWSSTSAAIWVRVPRIAGNGATKLRLYWGKAGAASASRDSAVFNASNGYEAVFHLNENTGDTARDASGARFKGVPVGTAPVNVPAANAVIGNAKAFGGVLSTTDLTTGGAFRLQTSTGGNTYNSFDYVGLNAAFTISAWVKVDSLPAMGAFGRRRGIVTKANAAGGDANDPSPLQWAMRPNTTDRILNFQRVSVPTGGSTAPFSVRPDSLVKRWTYVTYVANGTGVDDNLFRAYNNADRDTTVLIDEEGIHGDVDAFIGGFSSNSGDNVKSTGQQYLNGQIDEVRISKVSRSAAWVDLEYETQKPGATALTFGAAQNNDTSRVFLYPFRTAAYLLNQVIAPVTPYVKAGTTVSAYAVAPALPAGLSLSASTGVISGTPTAVSASTQYVITATIGGNPVRDTVFIAVTTGTPPGAPTGILAVAGNAQATVSWTAPASSGTFAITSYKAMAVSDTTKTCAWTAGPLTCVVTGLTNGTTYTFQVRAISAGGGGALSAASNAVTPATVPGAPTGVTAVNTTPAPAVLVSWTAPASNGGAAITSYKAMAVSDTAKFCTAAATSCTVTGLAGGTAYTFQVRAVNSVGASAASAPSASLTTTGILPGAFVIRVSGSARPFTFVLPDASLESVENVTLAIADVHGRTLWSKSVNVKEDKVRELAWDGKSSNGRSVSAGMYVVKISTVSGGKVTEFTRKAVTIKPH